MSEKKRRWFQIHLSTAVMLMFGAGILLWVNFRIGRDAFAEKLPSETRWSLWRVYEIGWPQRMLRSQRLITKEHPTGSFFEEEFDEPQIRDLFAYNAEDIVKWEVDAIAMNTLVGLLILSTSGVLIEFFVRRREARKP